MRHKIGSGDINAVTVEVYPDGRVQYMEQRNLTLETPMKLRPFPVDTQTLEARMIAFANDSRQLLLEVDERVLGATEEHAHGNKRVNIAQWHLLNLNMLSGLSDSRYYGASKQISEILFNIALERQSANNVWKVIVPLIVLVLLMCKSGRKEGAERVDLVVRSAFPIVYFVGLIITYLYFIGLELRTGQLNASELQLGCESTNGHNRPDSPQTSPPRYPAVASGTGDLVAWLAQGSVC